jgi:hypothetical protein
VDTKQDFRVVSKNREVVSKNRKRMRAIVSAETTVPKQRGRPFQKGVSGNPTGRPVGARNKTSVAVEALLDGEAEVLTRKAIDKANEGDMQALRLCLDRILPPRKDRPVSFSLPEITSPKQAAAAIASVLAAVAKGDITPTEASEVSKIVDVYVRAVETTELAERIARLERSASA